MENNLEKEVIISKKPDLSVDEECKYGRSKIIFFGSKKYRTCTQPNLVNGSTCQHYHGHKISLPNGIELYLCSQPIDKIKEQIYEGAKKVGEFAGKRTGELIKKITKKKPEEQTERKSIDRRAEITYLLDSIMESSRGLFGKDSEAYISTREDVIRMKEKMINYKHKSQ